MEAEKSHKPQAARPEATKPAPSQAAASRRGPDRKTLARAGGYQAQSALLRPEPDPDDRGTPEAARSEGPAPDAGRAAFPREAAVLALHAKVMSRPEFMETAVADLRRGGKVTLLARLGSWYRCRVSDGREGYIHSNRVDRKDIRLRSGGTGSGTVRGTTGDHTMSGRG